MPKLWPLLLVGINCCCVPAARGDGGTVRASERSGPYLVSAFTSPTPLRAGAVDVSAMVQDARTREPVPDASITVRLWPRDHPERAMARPATAEAATNKLFRAALFDVPAAGTWDAEVSVEGPRGSAAVRFAVEVGEPLPEVPAFAAWIAWPAAVIVVFAVHRLLVRRKNRTRSSSPLPLGERGRG